MIKELARLIADDLEFDNGESSFNVDSDIGDMHVICTGKAFASFYTTSATLLQPEESELITLTVIVNELSISDKAGEVEIDFNIDDTELENLIFEMIE